MKRINCQVPGCDEEAFHWREVSINNRPKELMQVCDMHSEAAWVAAAESNAHTGKVVKKKESKVKEPKGKPSDLEYILLYGIGQLALMDAVREYIRMGWEPQGGVAVRDNFLYQAMVRK